jgi:hypothetical protein
MDYPVKAICNDSECFMPLPRNARQKSIPNIAIRHQPISGYASRGAELSDGANWGNFLAVRNTPPTHVDGANLNALNPVR